MSSKFDKPYLVQKIFDETKVQNLFNYALKLDLEGLRITTLKDKIPLNVLNNSNENLIHTVLGTSHNQTKKLKLLKYLVSKNVSPDLPNSQLITPLHIACEKQELEIIKQLLDYGVNANAKDNYGRTPFHYLLSGVIKEWVNKKNKPLFQGERKSQPKDIFDKKIALKQAINEKLNQPLGLENTIKQFLGQLDFKGLVDFNGILEETFENLQLEDIGEFRVGNYVEKIKTAVSKLEKQLENFLTFDIEDIFEVNPEADARAAAPAAAAADAAAGPAAGAAADGAGDGDGDGDGDGAAAGAAAGDAPAVAPAADGAAAGAAADGAGAAVDGAEYFKRKTHTEYLDQFRNESKERLVNYIKKNIEGVEKNLKTCREKINTNSINDRNFTHDKKLLPKEIYLFPNKISPFYPLWNSEKNIFIANSEFKTLYTSYDKIGGLRDKITKNPLSIYYLWFKTSWNNKEVLPTLGNIPEISLGETYEEIKQKLLELFYPSRSTSDSTVGSPKNNEEKIEFMLFLAITLYLYNPGEMKELFTDELFTFEIIQKTDSDLVVKIAKKLTEAYNKLESGRYAEAANAFRAAPTPYTSSNSLGNYLSNALGTAAAEADAVTAQGTDTVNAYQAADKARDFLYKFLYEKLGKDSIDEKIANKHKDLESKITPKNIENIIKHMLEATEKTYNLLKNKLRNSYKSDKFPEFMFEVFHFLIENEIIEKRTGAVANAIGATGATGPIADKLYSNTLHLVKFLQMKDELLEASYQDADDAAGAAAAGTAAPAAPAAPAAAAGTAAPAAPAAPAATAGTAGTATPAATAGDAGADPIAKLRKLVNPVIQYELGTLEDDSYDKRFIDTYREATPQPQPHHDFHKATEDYLELLEKVTTTKDSNYVSKDENMFFGNTSTWILPSIREVMAYHYLVRNLDEVEMNQGIYMSRILGAKFVGAIQEITISDGNTRTGESQISTINPQYQLLTAKPQTRKSKYLTIPTVDDMLKKAICRYFVSYMNILGRGRYPLFKIFSLDNDKFIKYFKRVVPHHIKDLSLLEIFVKEPIEFINKLHNMNKLIEKSLSPIELNYNNYYTQIDRISRLNYVDSRLNQDARIIEIPNFYYYPLANEPSEFKILSYGQDDNTTNLNKPENKVEGGEDIDEIEKFYRNKIIDKKLRIEKTDLPETMKTPEGFNLMLQLNILKGMPKKIPRQVRELVVYQGVPKDEVDRLSVKLMNNILEELGREILNRTIKLKAYELLEDNLKTEEADIAKLIPGIKLKEARNVSYLQSTDIEFNSSPSNGGKGPSVFPIIKENNTNPEHELYFSNDYTSDEFVEKLYEIKYTEYTIEQLIKGNANPFITDNLDQSAVQILATNYMKKPHDVLVNLGLDFRRLDTKGFNFTEKIKEEIKYHNSFINTESNNFRDCIKDLVSPFSFNVNKKLDKSANAGFNKLRFTKVAFELVSYYLLVKEEVNNDLFYIISFGSNKVENDIALGKLINEDKSNITGTTKLRYNGNEDLIIDSHKNFMTDFKKSPALYLFEIEKVFDDKCLISKDSFSEDFAKNYFINSKFTENEEVKWVYEILELVTKQVLATQVIYLLSNLINAHLKFKFPNLDEADRVRIIEEDILAKILLDRPEKNNQNLLDIIRDELLPKLLKSVINIYDDEIEKDETQGYGVSDLTDEIVSCLKLIVGYFDEDDRLLDKIIPSFFTEYLEIYLPEMMRGMRCVAENILKWKINYKKLINIQTYTKPKPE